MRHDHVLFEILKRLDSPGPEALFFSSEETAQWPEGILERLQHIGILKPATPAKSVECPGCEENCFMPVHIIPEEKNRPARFFISCDKREDTSRIAVDPISLQRWHIDVAHFVSILADELATGHSPEEILQNKVYYLGNITLNRKKRSAFFIRNRKGAGSDSESLFNSTLLDKYSFPFFLVSEDLAGPREQRQGEVIVLWQVLSVGTAGLNLDLEELKRLLSKKRHTRRDIIPFSVPEETKWKNVFISFANEQTVQIKVGKQTEHRSFDEMGFSDARKAVSEPSGLWGIFRQLALLNGEMTFQDSANTFSDPKMIKKSVSQIRKKLHAVFPNILGDPFHPYKQAKGYKTRFVLNTLPSFM